MSSISQANYGSLANQISTALQPIRATVTSEAAPGGNEVSTADLDTFVQKDILTSNPELTKALGGNLSAIPFDYIADGCYARAQVMDQVFQDNQLANGKIFVEGDLTAKNGLFPNGVRWWYHVAPLVPTAGTNGSNEGLRVVDPGVSKTSLSPQAWISAIDPSQNPVTVQCTPREQYYPESIRGNSKGPFDISLASADATMVLYTQKVAQMRAAQSLNGGGPTPHAMGLFEVPVDTQFTLTAVPHAMDDNGDLRLEGFQRILTVEDPDQRKLLADAAARGQPVKVTHDMDTGKVTDVSPA